MIDLHYVTTGNNLKIAIMLEEVGLPYHLVKYDMREGTHLKPEFRAINPNNKLPAIVDHEPDDGGAPLAVFESGAILLYLASKTGHLMPLDFRRRMLANMWLIWQVAGLGPMHGQAHHFLRYAPEGQDYGVNRYRREARRLVDVVEYQLRRTEYLAGEYSVADIACYPWILTCEMIDIDVTKHAPAVSMWRTRISERAAVRSATAKIFDSSRAAIAAKRVELTPEQWSNMFGDRMHAAALPGVG